MLNTSQINQIIDITHQAGEEILKIYQTPFETQFKPDKSPVTIADTSSNQIVLNGLKELLPNIPFISEESEIPDYSIRKNWETLWLIDPLDGTREFVNRLDEFTVNIALLEKGQITFGIIYHPVRRLTFYAQKNQGAFKMGSQVKRLPQVKPILNHKNPLILAGSRSQYSRRLDRYIEALKPNFPNIEISRLGSSYKLCLVADGSVDIYPKLGQTMEWDTAAGQIICNEVGVELKQENSKLELEYNKEDLSNPRFLAAEKNSFEKLCWYTQI